MDRHPEARREQWGLGAMSAPARTPARFELEGYRAVAAVLVVVFHAYQHNRIGPSWRWPLEGTVWHEVLMHIDLVVDLFFVLSGFLLTISYARSALGDGEPLPARAFLIRRAVRLLPLYLVVVSLVWALSNPVLPGDWRDLLLHLTFTHVWSDDKIFYTNGPAWTLGVEAHFYVLLAILGALAQRVCARLQTRRARLTVLLGGVGTLIVLGLAYKLWAVFVMRYPPEAWSVWFGPPAKLDVLALGMLLAVAWAAGVRWPNVVVRMTVGLTGSGLTALGVWLPYRGLPMTFAHTLYGAGLTLVIGATALSGRRGPAWLRCGPMVSLATVSYSLYLWHEPVLRAIDDWTWLPAPGGVSGFGWYALTLLSVSLVVAYLSYWTIERTASQFNRAFDERGRPREYYVPLAPVSGNPVDRSP